MSLESVNVMNKQELGSNSSKTVEHGHDACDSHKSSPDREEGEVEDGEIDDDDEGKIDDVSGSPNFSDKPTGKRKVADDADSDNENHGSKRHKDRKRRHKKEKRHHHVSHKRRHLSPDHSNIGIKNDGSPQTKKSRKGEEDHRKYYDIDRPPSVDEDVGLLCHSQLQGHNTSSNKGSSYRNPNAIGSGSRSNFNNDDKRGVKRRSYRSGPGNSPRDGEIDKDSADSMASFDERESEGQSRMQDLFSDGDDLDLDVAAHERDGAFQRNSLKYERQPSKNKKKKNKGKWKDHWMNKARRDDDGPRRREPERKKCRFYMEGRCGKADHCPFSHDFKPPKKLELCKFYAISSCLKGEYCVYMHNDFPCKFHHTGNRTCKFDKDCKFSHEPLTAETKMVLERFLEERDSNNGDGNDGKCGFPTPFNLGEEERNDEIKDLFDDRKNSLLGSPPSHYKERNRNRILPRESPPMGRGGMCDPMRVASPPRIGPQGPTPPPNFGPAHRLSPNGQSLGPQTGASPQQGGAPQSGSAPINQIHRSFGFSNIAEPGMGGPMNIRPPPHLSNQIGMRAMVPPPQGGMTAGPAGASASMMLAGRVPQSYGPNARMPHMQPSLGPRPPANMLAPPNNAVHGSMAHNSMSGPHFGNMGMVGAPAMRGQTGPERPTGPPGAMPNPQLDDLASMLVNAAKQQQGKQQAPRGEEELEPTSMLKAAGADDSDFDEETDPLDALVHSMRKESEEQQRRQRGPPGLQQQPLQQPPQFSPKTNQLQASPQQLVFQSMSRPPGPAMQQRPQLSLQQENIQLHRLPQDPQQQMMMGRPDYPMTMGIRASYNPQQMLNQPNVGQPPFMGNRPPVSMHGPHSTRFDVPPQTQQDSSMETPAKQLYLRIAKQTANGMQEQLAREAAEEQKVPTAETPASPAAEPDSDLNLGPREWKLIPLDVPLKTPYPLMRLPHDLPYSRSDPRLTGQLRLVGAGGAPPSKASMAAVPPASEPSPENKVGSSPLLEVPLTNAPVSHTVTSPDHEVGGRAYTPSMSTVSGLPSGPKDPRLGRQFSSSGGSSIPEIPAALLQKPPLTVGLGSLNLDVEMDSQPDRPPPKMQLSERSSSFQAAPLTEVLAKTASAMGVTVTSSAGQLESRSYLLDPRFRRRKASIPNPSSSIEGDLCNSDSSALSQGTVSLPKRDTTPVPSSGESSPVD